MELANAQPLCNGDGMARKKPTHDSVNRKKLAAILAARGPLYRELLSAGMVQTTMDGHAAGVALPTKIDALLTYAAAGMSLEDWLGVPKGRRQSRERDHWLASLEKIRAAAGLQ